MSAMKMEGEPFTILLVEDNPAHAELVIRSFEDNMVINELKHVMDGEEALNYLFRRAEFKDPSTSPRPHVILLDLRLPKVDGLEVLTQIKADEDLMTIPVVVLTTSAAEADVTAAYDHHVNSYLVKPVNFEKFTQLMESLGFYWLGWNHNPMESK